MKRSAPEIHAEMIRQHLRQRFPEFSVEVEDYLALMEAEDECCWQQFPDAQAIANDFLLLVAADWSN